MKIRYQADADLNQNIVTGVLRIESAIDFQQRDLPLPSQARRASSFKLQLLPS